jgi:uncharacterized protein (DUF697 family)
LSKSLDGFFSDAGDESIVQDPFKFKAKLKIGSDAFTVLSKAENLHDSVNILTGSATGAAIVGTAWLSGLGTLGTLGLSLGVVTTPVGWIAAAGLGGGGVVFVLKKMLKKAKKSSVDEVPKYINTPLDILAANLVNLMLPPMIYVSGIDGEHHDKERETIINYFLEEWGISHSFIQGKYNELVLSGGHFDLQAWSESIGQLSESKDISYEELCEELITALEAVKDADGVHHDSEQDAIEAVRASLTREYTFFGMSWSSVKNSVSEGVSSLSDINAGKWVSKVFDASDRDVSESVELLRIERIPTIWMLGKTGAGKSSFTKKLTGYAHIPIGMGFMPCTQTMDEYLFPDIEPLLKLLDTRGLGEAEYDSSDDVKTASEISDLIVIVAKLDEPNQSDVLAVLKGAKKFSVSSNLVVLHTGEFDDLNVQTQRSLAFNQAQFDAVWHGDINHVRVDLNNENHEGHNQIKEALASVLPLIALLIEEQKLDGMEAEKLSIIHPLILRYSGLSSAAGVMPVVGSVSTLAAQGAMIKAIAEHHEIDWSRQTLLEFFSALGISFALTQAASLGGRALLSAVPVAGSVLSGGLAFATSYGFGRVADYYFFRKKNGIETSEEELQLLYKKMFTSAKSANV